MMDRIVLAFGTALVGAIATSSWQQVNDAVIAMWRRARPRESDEIEAELRSLRAEIVQARLAGDGETETALQGVWQVKLQQLLRAEPTMATDLQHFMEEVLVPVLAPSERTRISGVIMSGSSHDSSTFTQIGGQISYNWL
jgi:hypothetical protein